MSSRLVEISHMIMCAWNCAVPMIRMRLSSESAKQDISGEIVECSDCSGLRNS